MICVECLAEGFITSVEYTSENRIADCLISTLFIESQIIEKIIGHILLSYCNY